jgi:hypothetical protein
VENEFRWHTAGSREEGERHFDILMKMMRDIGFDVPIYFATAWGNAVTGEAMPTWGEYAAQPWEQNADELPPNVAYIIGSNPNEVPVGEYKERPTALGENKYARANVPYMTIEQGAGNQPTRLRRPIVTGEDNGAMLLCRLAQGLMGIGYYVFHGGINPVGALSTTQEYRNEEYMKTRDGYFCDLAERNYDFQGAVSMYNRITENGRELKIWNSFATEFKDILCKADVTLCEKNATDPSDLTSPRWSQRRLGDSGFLFFNNYMRRYTMPEKKISGFVFKTESECIALPDVSLTDGEFMAYPFNLRFGNANLRYATATPLCILNNDTVVLFNRDGAAEYDLAGDGRVIVLKKEDAKNSFKITLSGKEYLVLTDGEIYEDKKGYRFEYTCDPVLKIYPNPDALCGFEFLGCDGEFAIYSLVGEEKKSAGVRYKETYRGKEYAEYTVNVAYGDREFDNVYLHFDFSADLAEIYIDGEKVNDMYYTGVPFEVGMAYHSFPEEIVVRLYPLEEGREIYLEKKPRYENGIAMSLDGVSIECVGSTYIKIEKENQ